MLPLVGRTDELRAVSAAWRTLRDEPARCRIVVITGEIGAGKSRLAAEAVAALSPPPGPVLTGQARAHQPAPYDLTASALSGRGAAELGISVDALAWLTQRPEPATRRFAPEALLRTAVDAIRSLHRAGPGVLVVEDLHDLDPASLEVVDELAAAPDLPVLLLVTSRTARGLAGRVLARLCGTDRSTRLHLAPLSVEQVAAALPGRSSGDADLAARVWRRTGGNPSWLTELVAAGELTGPPGDQLVALATDRVPAGLVRLAQAAALLGEPVEPAALARFAPPADDGRPAPVAAVDRLVSSGVLRFDAGGGLRFEQPILAESLAAAALPSLRSAVGAARSNAVSGSAWPADSDATRRWASLTARERDVVRLLADGMTNRQLARALDISVRTATVHVSNVLRKTGAASRTEAALFALRHGVLDARG
ncbi:AAA family ATPase [Actinocatenispora thailandica]|uniref:AAA family ATPase n=1 Tax=Actinocatenispora thailandica TaxID=227318 RepID=UPI0031D5CE2C